MMRRCIFCGQSLAGRKKNFEHILPTWLAEHSDLAKRQTTISTPQKNVTVDMSKIGMKVCTSCNDEHANLESLAKIAFLKLESCEPLSHYEVINFLDWLDKFRIGIWLWYLQLSKGSHNIDPRFHVRDRIGQKDRIALVKSFKGDNRLKGFEFFGFSDSFMSIPSCLGFLANGLAIISASCDFMLFQQFADRRVNITSGNEDLERYELTDRKPLAIKPMIADPLILAQIIIPNDVGLEDYLRGVRFDGVKAPDGKSASRPLYGISPSIIDMSHNPTTKPAFFGNVDANIASFCANQIYLRDFVFDQFGGYDWETDTKPERLALWRRIVANAKSENAFMRTQLEQDYLEATGLRLRF